MAASSSSSAIAEPVAAQVEEVPLIESATGPIPEATVLEKRREYEAIKERIDTKRRALRERYRAGETGEERAAVLQEAREFLERSIKEDVLPAWLGTEWDFNGTSTVPGEGTIACGYFKNTVLRDAGVGVERIKLSQAPSEVGVKLLVPAGKIKRFSRQPVSAVVDWVKEQGEGIYVLGLDIHTGFLIHHDGAVRFCHSSFVPPVAVFCEDALGSAAMGSDTYRVAGKLFADEHLKGWLEGKRYVTPKWR